MLIAPEVFQEPGVLHLPTSYSRSSSKSAPRHQRLQDEVGVLVQGLDWLVLGPQAPPPCWPMRLIPVVQRSAGVK